MRHSVLIANRGEIACRLVQACHELGVEAISAYVAADRFARHVRLADRAVPVSSYLDVAAVLDAAKAAAATALHPGYGFLAENPELAEACSGAGVLFIGPPGEVIRLMGDKLAAKRLAASVGVPLVPGSETEDAATVGFPLLIKAAGGGGGRGMRIVEREDDFLAALQAAKREAKAAFGDERVFLERYISHGRHIEVQVFGDLHGQVMHLGERDCSIQRRYQKILEEAPAPRLPESLRRHLHESAVALAKAAHYVGPGTVEFMVDGNEYFFLEMNTRLQVEHPVTELVTGLDLAKLQLRVAFGAALPVPPETRGHAIEVRINAEDPDAGFLPATGTIRRLRPPEGAGIRNDVGVQVGDQIGLSFDPLLAKLIVWGADRAEALARLQDALRHYCILGVTTNLPFLLRLASDPDYAKAQVTTRFLEEHALAAGSLALPHGDLKAAAEAWQALRRHPDPFRHGWKAPREAELMPDGSLLLEGRTYDVVEDEHGNVEVWREGRRAVFVAPQPPSVETAALGKFGTDGARGLTAPMPGVVARVMVKPGDRVVEHQTLVVLEAMKIEHNVQAPSGGIVRRVHFKSGDLAPAGAVLIELE